MKECVTFYDSGSISSSSSGCSSVGGCESDLNVPKQTINAVGMELANSFYFIARSFTTAIKAIYSLTDSIMGLGHVIVAHIRYIPYIITLLHQLLAQFYPLESQIIPVYRARELVVIGAFYTCSNAA